MKPQIDLSWLKEFKVNLPKIVPILVNFNVMDPIGIADIDVNGFAELNLLNEFPIKSLGDSLELSASGVIRKERNEFDIKYVSIIPKKK